MQLVESREHLKTAAAALGLDMDQVLLDCYRDSYRTDHDGVYAFERHYRHNAKLVLPFRAAGDLLEALEDKENPPRFARQSDGSYVLVAHRPRRHLIDQLSRKTLVVLDATMPPALKMLLPDLKELHYRVKQNLHVTQVTTGLYTKRDLFNETTRERVEAAIRAFASDGRITCRLSLCGSRTVRKRCNCPKEAGLSIGACTGLPAALAIVIVLSLSATTSVRLITSGPK